MSGKMEIPELIDMIEVYGRLRHEQGFQTSAARVFEFPEHESRAVIAQAKARVVLANIEKELKRLQSWK